MTRLGRSRLLLEAVLWFGLGGGALAWSAQLVVGSEVEETRCTPAGMRWDLAPRDWEIALTAACGLVALAAALAALAGLRETRRGGGDRRGRFHFMAVSGILANTLFLALILLGGIASSVLDTCVQS
jgi:hypothetical protein